MKKLQSLIVALCVFSMALPLLTQAEDPQILPGTDFNFTGGGVSAGLNQASSLSTVSSVDLQTTIQDIINAILNILGGLAVLMVVLAGTYLVIGQGSEDSRDKAFKMILYTIIGIAIVLFSRAIVFFYYEVL